MRFEFGEIVLVPFPFTNQESSKRRPALIVSNLAYNATRPDVVIMAITSQLRPHQGDIWITGWQGAGLLKPSAIKPVFATVEKRLIVRRLSVLPSVDQAALRRAIHEILG